VFQLARAAAAKMESNRVPNRPAELTGCECDVFLSGEMTARLVHTLETMDCKWISQTAA
jgi:hypothetical protein